MISEAIGKSVTTVRKYVCELEERGLITTERTSVITRDGRKQNGRLRYHILPIRLAIERFNERQLRAAELEWARQKMQAKLSQRCAAQEPPVPAGQPTTPTVLRSGVRFLDIITILVTNAVVLWFIQNRDTQGFISVATTT